MTSTRRRQFLVLIVFHIAVTGFVFAAGRLGIAGGLINQAGDLSFASDGVVYRKEAIFLGEVLKTKGISTWNAVPFQLHVKIFSLLFIALGSFLGYTILAIEPWNALCYSLTVLLVFKLGEQVFDSRVGMVAAVIVALWPSFLLHTTQFLKDPALIVGMLSLVLIVTSWLTRILPLRFALLAALAGEVLVILLRHLRREMWLAAVAAIVIGCVFLVARQVKERKWYLGNTAGAFLLLVAAIATPLLIAPYRTPPQLTNQRTILPPVGQSSAPIVPRFLTRLRNEAAETRSAVDAQVEFQSHADIVRYLPKATLIGLFAPFPSMWFSEGYAVGRAGRWLSGAEMLLTYFFVALALVAVWLERRRLSVHALWILVLAAAAALGLTVANIGTLYRMRYPFWILLVLLASRGLLHFIDRVRTTSH